MKRILIFNDTLNFGGTEMLLTDILKNMSVKPYDITLLLPYPDLKNILLNDIPSNITIKYIYPGSVSRIKKIIHENIRAFFPAVYNKITGIDLKPYDLVICFKDSIYSVIFTTAVQPKILWIHNLPSKYKYGIRSIKEYLSVSLLKSRITRLIRSYRKFDHIICVSNSVMKRYTEVYNHNVIFPHQQIHVIYNAIDFQKTDNLSQAFSVEKTNLPHFIMATRFSPEKRIDRVIEACKKLTGEGYSFTVSVLGDGEQFKQAEKLISDYQLENIIRLEGFKENPYPYMKAADWLICSSEKESFSLVLLESIYLGTPVITTDCGGPTEITADGKYGLLTENSTEGIYAGMKKVLNNPQIADKFKLTASECLQRFNYKEWLDKVENILKI